VKDATRSIAKRKISSMLTHSYSDIRDVLVYKEGFYAYKRFQNMEVELSSKLNQRILPKTVCHFMCESRELDRSE